MITPIDAPQVIRYGIAVYAPPLPSVDSLTLEILYSESPNPRIIPCSTSTRLWKRESEQGERGTLFLWKKDNQLTQGYYTLILEANNRRGYCSIALTAPTDYWIVGLPYSIYPPIPL
jgi:hypothetical protein